LQADSLLSVVAEVAGEHRANDVFQGIVRGLALQSGVAVARIWLLSPVELGDQNSPQDGSQQSESFHLVASSGRSRDGSENWSSIDGSSSRVPKAYAKVDLIGKTGDSVLIRDLTQNKEWIDPQDWIEREGLRSFVANPLVCQGKIIGVLDIFSREELTDQDSLWVRIFSDQAAVAITNALAFEALQRARAIEEQHTQQLRQVIDLAPLHMFIWEADGSASYGNKRSAEYFGKIPQMPPMEFLDLVAHPDDSEKLKRGIQNALSSGEPLATEVRLRRHDGEYRWFLYQLSPLHDEQGRLTRWCGTRIDIEEGKRAAEQAQKEYLELRDHFNQVRQMMDVVPQHMFFFDSDGTQGYSNRAARDFFDWKGPLRPQEFLARYAHPEDRARMSTGLEIVKRAGKPFQVESRLLGRDGQYHWFLEHIVPIHDGAGKIVRWCGVRTDIDEQKRAKEQTDRENLVLREEIDKASMFEEIVGTSPALQAVLARVSKVAPSDSTVLVTGETGTGKELIARAIHKRSQRATRAFVSVNCAAIPRDLIASELFGHEKGAFTGALQRRLGRFELAEGGTIFLDEIGELNAETQVMLLRVLQEREFERVGGTGAIRADVRVVAATHRDLPGLIADGTFRSDLFYRINVFPIEVPPLRERKEDIRLLVGYFIDRYATKVGRRFARIEKKTMDSLQNYPWPGNIRELQNVIERSVIICDTDEFSIDESWLPREPKNTRPLADDLLDQERERIEDALSKSKGRVSGPKGAASALGMPASTLDSKIKSFKIDKRRYQSP
jgi:PAS domain S-box-containing protein